VAEVAVDGKCDAAGDGWGEAAVGVEGAAHIVNDADEALSTPLLKYGLVFRGTPR
jgi:hypothetical protein